MSNAINDVILERRHQVEDLRYNTAHDDQHDQKEIARAAGGYVHHYIYRTGVPGSVYQADPMPPTWPWDEIYWNPQTPREDLVRAAALIIAEIERIDRAAVDAARGL